MTVSEVVAFILPQMDDPIQIVFLAIFLALITGTVVCAHLSARTTSWEKKWNRGTPSDTSDDLDIEHGSVTDLWHAVATAPEKVAEIMPGMLLVIGLLGTFLGLGLALNSASKILGHADAMSAGAAADSMSHLMTLLQGLGTKFKTSTWGILGFVLMKLWSEITRFDEKRLTWVIAKVKVELERRKRDERAAQASQREALHSQIASAADKIVTGIFEQTKQMLVLEKGHHQQVLERFDVLSKSQEAIGIQVTSVGSKVSDSLAEQTQQMLEQDKKRHQEAQSHLDGLRKGQGELLVELRASKEAMEQLGSSMRSVVDNMAEAATQMASGADRIGSAADRMGQGADKVGAAANGLVGAVGEFQQQFTQVLNDVRKDLGKAVTDMSKEASSTLEKGSKQLSDATEGISTALGVLSGDVKNTMSAVKDSIGEALTIQRNSARVFTESSEALIISINTSNGMIDKVTKSIESGLSAVSNSSNRMRDVCNSLDKSLEIMMHVSKKLDELPVALHPLADSLSRHQEMISALGPLHHLPANQQLIIEEMKGLRSDFISHQASQNHHSIDA